MGPVTYKIQRHPQVEPDIVHVDKLMHYYPDFREELHSWIETDHPSRYRDQGGQTTRPALQSQLTAVVDIPPQIFDPTPDPEPALQPADPPNIVLEPDETNEANMTKSAETDTQPVVLDTRLNSTTQAATETSARQSAVLETEVAPAACPDVAPSSLLADQTEPEGPDDSPEVETISQSSNPDPGALETLVGSRSPVLLPRRGTRPCKQPERYAPVHRLQVLPVNQAQTEPSIRLFPKIAVTLSTRSDSCPTSTLNSTQTDIVLFGMSSWPSFCT